MSSLLKNLLLQRGILSMEEAKPGETDEKKEPVGDGGSTPDGSEAAPGEVDPTTPVDEVPPTDEVPSKADEEGTEGDNAGTEGDGGQPADEGASTPAEGDDTTATADPDTVPNPDEGGAEPGESDDDDDDEFEEEDDEDEFDESDEEEFEETVDELDEAQKADLAMANLIIKVRDSLADGGLSGREAAMVADRAGAILGKVDLAPTPTPSQECFGSFGERRTSTQLSLEALQEDQKAVEQKKEGIIAKLLKFIRHIWQSLFGNKEVFNRQVQVAGERAAKIEENRDVVLKGTEGIIAGYAALVGKNTFFCGELAQSITNLTNDVRGLVSQFMSVAGNDEVDEDFVANFVGRTRALSRLGTTREEYVEKTNEYSNHEVTVKVVPSQVPVMISKFDAGFKASEDLMKQVEGVTKRACAAGNSKQLNDVLSVVRMFANVTKAGPALAIRLAVKEEAKAA